MEGGSTRRSSNEIASGRGDGAASRGARGGPGDLTHALEFLRVSATFLVLFYHAALTYLARPMRLTLWMSYDGSRSVGFDVFVYWINGFVMPLFFLAAGVSVPAACQARGAREFLKHRTRRLLRPLLFGCVAILPLTYALWGYGLITTGRCDEDQILAWRFGRALGPSVYGFLHLWFLEYLFLVCALWAGAWTVLRRWKPSAESGPAPDREQYRWLATIWRPFLPALVTFAIFLVDSDTMLRVDNTMLPNPSRVIHYMVFFTVGAWISQIRDPKGRLMRFGTLYSVLALVVFAVMVPLLLRHAAAPLTGNERLAFCALAAVFPWLTVFGGLGVCLRLVRDRGPAMRFLAEASFWVYIVHIPIVGLVQILLLPLPWPAFAKFLLVAAAAVLLSLLSYEYQVRRSLIGELINGSRKRSKNRGWLGPEFGWIASAVVIVVMAAWGTWSLRAFFFTGNIHEVVPGQVYRSARLRPNQLDREIKRLRIRTVIAINDDGAHHFWVKQQLTRSDLRDVTFKTLALPALRAPSPDALAELVALIDGAPRPILIEGQRGIRNVSLASAIARMLGGEAPDVALREFSLSYGEFTAFEHSELAKSVLEYRRWLVSQRQPHTADAFRTWARSDYAANHPRAVPAGQASATPSVASEPARGGLVR